MRLALLSLSLLAWAARPAGLVAQSAPLLAEGPFPIVTGQNLADGTVKRDPGTLYFLTGDRLVYQRQANGRVQELKPGVIHWVESADKASRWEAVKGEFHGPTRRPPPVDLTPLPSAAKNENTFAYRALRQLLRDFDAPGVSADDAKAIRATINRYARRASLSPAIKTLCQELLKLVDARDKRDTEVKGVLGAATEIKGDIDSHFRRAQMAAMRQAMERLDLDDLLFSGFLAFGQAASSEAALLAERNSLMRILNQEANRKLTAVFDRYETARQHAWNQLLAEATARGLGESRPLRERETLLKQLIAKKDYEQIARLCRQDAEAFPDDPFALSEACRWEALTPEANKARWAARARQRAEEAVVAVRMVPPAEDYDLARCRLLATACFLACSAAEIALHEKGWANAYNLDAAYAVRLIDRYNAQANVYEMNGVLREMRAWALAQSGRPREALDQAVKVEPLREKTPLYGYNLGRLYGLLGEPRKAMEWLERGIKIGGFNNILELKRNPDYNGVRNVLKKPFDDLTKVNVFPAARFADLTVTNQSAFALTNVSVKVDFVAVNGKRSTLTYSDRFARVEPQETVLCKDIFKDVAVLHVDRVTVECDQNRRR